jgi:hypothetical protein
MIMLKHREEEENPVIREAENPAHNQEGEVAGKEQQSPLEKRGNQSEFAGGLAWTPGEQDHE